MTVKPRGCRSVGEYAAGSPRRPSAATGVDVMVEVERSEVSSHRPARQMSAPQISAAAPGSHPKALGASPDPGISTSTDSAGVRGPCGATSYRMATPENSVTR